VSFQTNLNRKAADVCGYLGNGDELADVDYF